MYPTQDPEVCRLDALAELDILDTPRELAFDRLTALCRKVFRVPMSTLSFIDGHRQWFKASEGMEARQTERRPAPCNYAIAQLEPLVIADTLLDPRFADSEFVRGAPFVRFYAGAQLRVSGATVGTLCAFDTRPRDFSAEEIGILTDLAAIAVDELLLRNLSMQDMLTGTSSRRALRSEGERLTSLAARQGTDLACAVFDIDQLRAINERCGQAIGDMVLSSIAGAAKRSMRGGDVIGRMGGGTFAILLPHTRLDQAMGVVEGIRVATAAGRIQSPVGAIGATCSFGTAVLAPGQCFDDLLRNAGLAMNSAKQAGRNHALAWVDPAPPLAPTARRVFKAGKISFNSGHSTLDCTVRALSRDTATIEVISTANVPEQFKLSIAADSMSRACRVTSKADHRIEVAFV